jgi:sensor histidine kinase YesM
LIILPYNAWLAGVPFELTRIGVLFDGSLYHSFVLMAWSVLYFAIRYYQDLQTARERALKAETAAQRARLQALRYQLNPHFLFNTLNAISTLVVEGHNGAAGRMIAQLSDFLRLTLDGSDAREVPLVEEVTFARRYLEIEQVRFGPRLATRFDVDADTYSALVPNLILQPLVENAVRHAVAPREAGGRITVSAQRIDSYLYLRVRDDGPGLSGDATDVFDRGVGLANTRARLEEHYGPMHRFLLERSDGGGLTVTLVLPFRKPPNEPPLHPAAAASHPLLDQEQTP